MTETKLIAFRCPAKLLKALEKQAAKVAEGEPPKELSEIIVRTLCDAFKIKYSKPLVGRPRKDKG